MSPARFFLGVALTWLALPLTALDYALAWGSLPDRVVMKTDAAGQPIAWATRGDAMTVSLGAVGFTLLVATAASFPVARQHPERMGAALVVLVVVACFITLVANGILWGYQVP